LCFAFLLPIAIGLLSFLGLFDAVFSRPLDLFIYQLMALLPFIKIVHAASEHISHSKPFLRTFFRGFSLVPGFFVYGSDLKKGAIPGITLGLIATNIFLFFVAPERIVDMCVFVPCDNPSALHVFLSIFTCAFFHATPRHLFGNMLFLWAVGSVLEPRVGSLRFLFLYFACILTSGVVDAVFLMLKAVFSSSGFDPGTFHSLGASGAIAGIIGIFVVRCYFSKLKIAIPFMFFPIFSLPVKVNVFILSGIFFTRNFAGSVSQFRAAPHIDHWAHVGGYVGGFFMAYLLKLHRDASREGLKVAADRMSSKPLGKKEAIRRYGEILQEEPENEKALRYLFDFHRYNQEKREHYFGRLIEVLVKKDFLEAVALFSEHFPSLKKGLPGNILLRFGLYFQRSGDLERAWPCFELASEMEGPWQPKAIYALAMVYEELGRDALAKGMFEQVAKKFPDSPFQNAALEKLDKTTKRWVKERSLLQKNQVIV